MIKTAASLPTVTVVLPCRNEAAYVAMAIASVRRQQYPQERIEIIVVDNGSTDDSVAKARAAGATVLTRLNCRVGAVRNEGVRQGAGEVLAFLDSDCEAGEFWLADAVRLLYAETGVGLVGGMCCAPVTGSWIERAWAPTQPSAVERAVGSLGCPGLVVKRSVFEQLHGFDEVLEAAEDDDFCRKVREAGLGIVCSPKCAVVHHGYPKSLYAIARRQVWHGSNQLESSTGIRDYLLVLTHAFLFGFLLVVAGAFVDSRLSAAGALMMAGVVAVSSLVRLKRRGYGRTLTGFVQVYLVLTAYYTGRAIGLVNNYLKVIKRWLGLRV